MRRGNLLPPQYTTCRDWGSAGPVGSASMSAMPCMEKSEGDDLMVIVLGRVFVDGSRRWRGWRGRNGWEASGLLRPLGDLKVNISRPFSSISAHLPIQWSIYNCCS